MTRDGVATDPIARALWYIESHFAEEITLDDVAAVAGVSRYHLSRTFGLATGSGLMAYVRGRRLSEAARALAAGAPDILAVALDWGYGSHEAFSRAFREQFDLTPDAVRARGSVTDLPLLEALRMDDSMLAPLDPPRIVEQPALLIAGLNERYDHTASAAIPSQWQRFTPHLDHVPGQIGHTAYGVIHNSDDTGHADYLTGVEVKDFRRSATPCSRTGTTFPRSGARGSRSGTRGCPTRGCKPPAVRSSSATTNASTAAPDRATWRSGFPSARTSRQTSHAPEGCRSRATRRRRRASARWRRGTRRRQSHDSTADPTAAAPTSTRCRHLRTL